MKARSLLFLKFLVAAVLIGGWHTGHAQTLVVTDSTTNSCNNDGTLKVYVTGGNAPYSYTIAAYNNTLFNQLTQSSPVFTGLPPGYYYVTVTDANGLNNANQYSYGYIGSRFYAFANVTPAICPATVGSETANAYQGTGPYTYLWSSGATTQTITNVPVGSQYQCTVTDQTTGCIVLANDSGVMTQTSSITTNITSTVANCTNGTATVVASNGMSPYTYVWSNGQTTAQATGLSAGYPEVTVTDAQGCSMVSYANITQGLVISTTTSYTAEHCNDGNGTATVTALNGSAPFTYLWSTGNTTANIGGLSGGYYSVVLTDHNGCTASNSVNVQKSTPITLTATATTSLCTSNTGSVTVSATGGTSPYSYVWNTSPIQATATATGLPAGYYSVVVVDAVGCQQVQSAQVTNNTTLGMSLSKTDAVCGGTSGTVDVTAYGGSTPYTYLWNTTATTTTITGIHQAGSYSCVVTDALGCHVSAYTYVESVSPVMISINTNNASCIYTADGSASISAAGGLAPYTWGWSNGQTTASVTGLLTGGYYAYATDANGCSSGHYLQIGYNSVLPCVATISGSVYDDHDGNCMINGLDAGLNGVWVGCFPGGGYQWTDYAGSFNFTLPPGSYSLAQTPPLYHTVICPAAPPTVTLAAGQSYPNYDFYNEPDSVRDLAIDCINYTPPVAGFVQHQRLFVRNLGTFSQNPNVVYMHSADVTFMSSSPVPDSYDPASGQIIWNGPLMAANGINTIDLYFSIPTALPTGHILNNSDTVYPIAGDTSAYNNYQDNQGLVVRSYDPNYIDVLPAGIGAPGYIATTDSILRYAVHFQNTGSYPATFVTLKIPVDSNLDISKFQFIGASHQVTSITADTGRMMTIRFDYINLPDSGTDRLGSQGFAAFTFNQKKGLQPLVPITEKANIYFDFNTPVATNNALNTINGPNGIKTLSNGDLKAYPNPTTGNVTLDLTGINEDKMHVTIYDISGRAVIDMQVNEIPLNKRLTLNTASLTTGIYIVEATGTQKYTQKIAKTE